MSPQSVNSSPFALYFLAASLEFLIETSLGFLNITGSELTLVRLDQDQHEVSIQGHIDGISYVSDKKKTVQKEKGFAKLLK